MNPAPQEEPEEETSEAKEEERADPELETRESALTLTFSTEERTQWLS